MEPASALAGALIAGALAASKDLGGQVLKDAYGALKKLLEDGYAFATSRLIDTDPENTAFKDAVEAEVGGKPGAVADPKVQALTQKLLDVLASVPEREMRSAGIDVGRIVTGRDLIASGQWIRGEVFKGGRDVVLTAAPATGAKTLGKR